MAEGRKPAGGYRPRGLACLLPLAHAVAGGVRHPYVGAVEGDANREGTDGDGPDKGAVAGAQHAHGTAEGVRHPHVGAVEGGLPPTVITFVSKFSAVGTDPLPEKDARCEAETWTAHIDKTATESKARAIVIAR
jgi:hypothetical protein